MRHWWVLWLLISGIVIAVAVVVESVLHMSLVYDVRVMLTEPSVLTALAIVGLLGLDLFLPIPSSVVMVLSGSMFGVYVGGGLSLLGMLAGNILGFELARKYGLGVSERLVGRVELNKMHRTFARYGPAAIMVSRPVPVVMETVSLIAGLSAMSRRTFLLASGCGTVPVCFVYAYAGAFAMRTQSLVPMLLLGIGLPMTAWCAVRALRSTSA